MGTTSVLARVILALLPLVGAGCALPSLPRPSPSPPVVATRWAALLVGTLQSVDDCLRVVDAEGVDAHTLVWPAEYDGHVTAEGDSVRVVDRDETVVLVIGETVHLGGGQVSSFEFLVEELRSRVSRTCPGPYWVVGDVVGPMRRLRGTQ